MRAFVIITKKSDWISNIVVGNDSEHRRSFGGNLRTCPALATPGDASITGLLLLGRRHIGIRSLHPSWHGGPGYPGQHRNDDSQSSIGLRSGHRVGTPHGHSSVPIRRCHGNNCGRIHPAWPGDLPALSEDNRPANCSCNLHKAVSLQQKRASSAACPIYSNAT